MVRLALIATCLSLGLSVAPDKPEITSLTFNHDGSCVAAGFDDGELSIWDASTKRRIVFVKPLSELITQVRFIKDDSILLALSETGQFVFIDAHSGKLLKKVTIDFQNWIEKEDSIVDESLEVAEVSPDGTAVAIAGNESTEVFILDSAALFSGPEKLQPRELVDPAQRSVVKKVLFRYEVGRQRG